MTLDVEKATSRFHPRGSKPSASISSRSCPASRPFSRACRRSNSSLIIVIVVHRLSFQFRWFFWRASLHHPPSCQTWAPRLEARRPPAPPRAPPTKQQASTELPWLQELPHLDIVMINMAESCHHQNHQKKNGSRTIMINDYNKQAATNCDNFLIVPSVSSRFWILLRLFSAFSSSSSTSICKSAILSTFGKRWLLGKHWNNLCCPYRQTSLSLRKSP